MSNIKLFQDKKIRTYHDEIRDQWYFSIVDAISVLTDSSIPKRYWSDLKKKLLKEGFQLYEKIVQLKSEAADGKKYATDCAETSILLRIIQSIPSPKAEPFKQWLAQIANRTTPNTVPKNGYSCFVKHFQIVNFAAIKTKSN